MTSHAASQGKRPLVLVIEDDKRLTPALAMMIEDWGFDCVAVGSTAEASAALGLRAAEVVVIVADLSDGDHWGSDRTLAAISTAIGRDVPVIATCTHPGQARRNGFGSVLT